jgi:Do/DeqQ family serine protease
MKKILTYLLFVFLTFSASAEEKKLPDSKSAMQLSFAPLVKKATPAVVNIYSKLSVKVQLSPLLNDPVFRHFFGNLPQSGAGERVISSLGSGVIVSGDGHIITNNHVINGSTDITVVLADRREFAAKILVTDERTDLALLKIDTGDEKLPFLEFMDSDLLEVGDLVLAVGNPFGIGQTVTSGIVSALARTTIGVSDYQFFIQTDAAINPGNSGGALINMDGKLAGINSAIFSKSGGSEGMGFAIPANMVQTVVKSNGSHITRPWLGIAAQGVTAEMAKSLAMERPTGVIISKIYKLSPLAEAGLEVGDVILSIDGHEITDENGLRFRAATYEIGSKATLQILSKSAKKEINITMKAAPEEPKRDLRTIKGANPLAGATIGNISPALADEIGLNIEGAGVVITNLDQGNAAKLGFAKNDIIKTVNGHDIKTTKDLENAMNNKPPTWKITIQRGKNVLNIIWNVNYR